MFGKNTTDDSSSAASTSKDGSKKVPRKNHKPAYRVPSIKEKLNMIERIESGEHPSALALEFGIHEYSVRRIYRRKEDFYAQDSVLQKHQGSAKRMRYTGIEETKFEKVLFDWYTQQRDLGIPVSGSSLKNTAIELNTTLGGSSNFKASNGWLHGFKKRHGIGEVKIQEESKPVVESSDCQQFVSMLQGFLEIGSYTMDNVYNADETTFFWRHLPGSLSTNQSNDEITIMVSTNVTGTHKIPLLAIGKEKQPVCFKKLKVLPVRYTNQLLGCMDKEVFKYWFKEIFIPSVNIKNQGRNEKIALIVKKSTFYPCTKDLRDISSNCEVIILPSNVQESVQPMNQGIIEMLKRGYHTFFCKDLILNTTDQKRSMLDFLKQWNLLKCFVTLSNAWENIKLESIRRSWKYILTGETLPKTEIENDNTEIQAIVNAAFCKNFTSDEITDWLNFYTNNCKSSELSIELDVENDDTVSDATENSEISAKEAYKALFAVHSWLLTRSDTQQEWLVSLNKARELAGNVALEEEQLPSFLNAENQY